MNLYERVLAETQPFLGKKTEQFVNRQCRYHLKVEPKWITVVHLPELAKWMGNSAKLLLPREKAAALRQKIESLSSTSQI